MSRPLTFAVIGCGVRGRTYMRAAREFEHRAAAIADISEGALTAMEEFVGDQEPQIFTSGEELLSSERLADVALICTQDAQHFQHASIALRRGYDVVLEKPAAQNFAEIEELARLAVKYRRKLILCFVLRYSPFYQTIHRMIREGAIGDIVSILTSEGVGPWHHSHAFVRGKWSNSAESTPMIVAKCCHDFDMLTWLTGSRMATVSSHENCSHFRSENAPPGAPDRCTSACPHTKICRFDAHRYLGDQRSWLASIHPDAETMDDEAILNWLKTSDWGKCVYRSEHDTPDHQVVGMQFENGVTATHTMTAFDDGRRIRVCGSEGTLDGTMARAGRPPRLVRTLHEGFGEEVEIQSDNTEIGQGFWSEQWHGHGDGDFGLIAALPEMLSDDSHDPTECIEGHRIAFAAALAAKK